MNPSRPGAVLDSLTFWQQAAGIQPLPKAAHHLHAAPPHAPHFHGQPHPQPMNPFVAQYQSGQVRSNDYGNVTRNIAWIFPTEEQSTKNSSVPILNPQLATGLVSIHAKNFRKTALRTLLNRCGLQLFPNGQIGPSSTYNPNQKWDQAHCMRITRVLKSLTLLGQAPLAESLVRCLNQLKAQEANRDPSLSTSLYVHWNRGINDARNESEFNSSRSIDIIILKNY